MVIIAVWTRPQMRPFGSVKRKMRRLVVVVVFALVH